MLNSFTGEFSFKEKSNKQNFDKNPYQRFSKHQKYDNKSQNHRRKCGKIEVSTVMSTINSLPEKKCATDLF